MITYPDPFLPAGEHRFVKVLSKVLPIIISHRPHGPNNASESTVLYRSSKMQRFIGRAPVGQFRRVASRQECKFSMWELRSYNVDQRQALASVKLE
jgi:hypothetical protein